MKKISAKSKLNHHHLRHKYKRYAAAVAGAAIMAGVALPGIPAAKVLAAENPSNLTSPSTNIDKDNTPPVRESKTVSEKENHNDRNGPPGRGWREHKYSWPGPDENQGWYEDGHIYYRSDRRDHDSDNRMYVLNISSPVDFVRDHAAAYGFDSYLDSFRFLTVTYNTALVEVTQHGTGKVFNVLLRITDDHTWNIVDVHAV